MLSPSSTRLIGSRGKNLSSFFCTTLKRIRRFTQESPTPPQMDTDFHPRTVQDGTIKTTLQNNHPGDKTFLTKSEFHQLLLSCRGLTSYEVILFAINTGMFLRCLVIEKTFIFHS
jgi:hypothetical protein